MSSKGTSKVSNVSGEKRDKLPQGITAGDPNAPPNPHQGAIDGLMARTPPLNPTGDQMRGNALAGDVASAEALQQDRAAIPGDRGPGGASVGPNAAQRGLGSHQSGVWLDGGHGTVPTRDAETALSNTRNHNNARRNRGGGGMSEDDRAHLNWQRQHEREAARFGLRDARKQAEHQRSMDRRQLRAVRAASQAQGASRPQVSQQAKQLHGAIAKNLQSILKNFGMV